MVCSGSRVLRIDTSSGTTATPVGTGDRPPAPGARVRRLVVAVGRPTRGARHPVEHHVGQQQVPVGLGQLGPGVRGGERREPVRVHADDSVRPVSRAGPENAVPGTEGITRGNASAGSPPPSVTRCACASTTHDGTESLRTTEPRRLVCTGGRWYLVGWDTGRADWPPTASTASGPVPGALDVALPVPGPFHPARLRRGRGGARRPHHRESGAERRAQLHLAGGLGFARRAGDPRGGLLLPGARAAGAGRARPGAGGPAGAGRSSRRTDSSGRRAVSTSPEAAQRR
jgi:hypothetical protein